MSIIQKRKTNVPLQTLRRLAPRGMEVVSEHGARSPAIALFTQTLVPVAEAFVTAYDQSRSLGPGQKREQMEASAAIAELSMTIRSWLGHLSRDIEGFAADAYARGGPVPDDVVADAVRLLELVRGYNQTAAEPLGYVDEVVAAVEPVLAKAQAELQEAKRVLASNQELRSETRRLAGELQRELVALRRTLRAVLGSSHRDYRSLLVSGSAAAADEAGGDDEAVEVEADDPQSLADAEALDAGEEDATTNAAE